MDRDTSLSSSYLEWLGLTWEHLEDLDAADADVDFPAQSPVFTRALYRMRRECEILASSVGTQHAMGTIDAMFAARVCHLLHDLRWILEVSPAAPPALARQCVRMGQDRIFAEVQEMHALAAPSAVEVAWRPATASSSLS